MSLLQHLREQAVELLDNELPSTEELRPIVGALIKELEKAAGVTPDADTATAAAVVEPAPEPVPVVPPTPEEQLASAEAEIAALKAQLAGQA